MALARPKLMGILNVTPDSFSDGGRYFSIEAALKHALQLVAEGADIVDVGGESTRPGSEPVSTSEELARVLPVIQALRARSSVRISIDTTKAKVAAEALSAGANMINDVSAGLLDPEMFAVAKQYAAELCLMHMRGTPQTMQQNTRYHDVVKEVCDYLRERANMAMQVGVAAEKILLDPGIGFGKSPEDNVKLLQHTQMFVQLGFPVLIGTSRKSFIGKLLQLELEERLEAGLATMSYAWQQGAQLFRVHDVAATKRYFDMLVILNTCEGSNLCT